MALLSLIAVLLIEQVRPLSYREVVHGPLSRLARFLETRFNGGEHGHGVVAWCVGVGGLVLLAGGIHAVLRVLNPVPAWLWTVLVLYLTLGFRQFSHFYTDIHLALRMNDLPHARQLLAEWRKCPEDGWTSPEIARLAIRQALTASHAHVFGVLLCFVLLPGPCGAVLYRAAACLAEDWAKRSDGCNGDFGGFARQAFAVIDWLPARMTALSFAVVGNFESAIYCWKARSAGSGHNAGFSAGQGAEIVRASGAGALGVQLDAPADDADDDASPRGEEADMEFMQSAVGLVWRALLLWLLLLSLFTLASLMRFG